MEIQLVPKNLPRSTTSRFGKNSPKTRTDNKHVVYAFGVMCLVAPHIASYPGVTGVMIAWCGDGNG